MSRPRHAGTWYAPAPAASADLPVAVTEIGASDWGPGDHAARACSGVLALELVLEGEIRLIIDGSVHAVGAGRAFWLRPGERHWYGCAGRRLRKQYIGLAGAWAVGLASSSPPVIAMDERIWTRAFAGMRRELARARPGTASALAAIAYRLLLAIRPETAPRGSRSADPLVVEARARLERALGSTVDITGRARDLGLGRVALHRRFRAATGSSPLRYWQDLQTRRAQGLLIGSGLPIRAIAARLGYGDPLYFSRVFHRRTGLSPLAFRDRHRAAE